MNSNITANVGSFAVALVAGAAGTSGAGSGANAYNEIQYDTVADVYGASISAALGEITISAEDSSTIAARVESAAIAGTYAGVGSAVAISVSLASALIGGNLRAAMRDSAVEPKA